MDKKIFQDETDVLKYQREKLSNIDNKYNKIDSDLEICEKRVKEFLLNQGINQSLVNKYIDSQIVKSTEFDEGTSENTTFSELISDAHDSGYLNVDLLDIASSKEINEVHNLLDNLYYDYSNKYKLDKYDYAISGVVGTIAALTDYFLVTKVSKNKVTAGKMKSGVEKLWSKLLSDNKIKNLEKEFKVCYDISTNTSKISQNVLGLSPSYHRFQSLGHDPILGFIFGVIDLMKGQLTAIDGNGRLIIQDVQDVESKSFVEAIISVFGHLLSDVAAKSDSGKILSVPAPLTPLIQLAQVGSINYCGKEYSIADLSKKMYSDGYNMNHFIGMSIPVIITEVLIRFSFVIKEMFFSKLDAKVNNNPKLNTMLCISNGILFAENVGKLAITKNPFAINYISWITTAKYGFKTLKWISHDCEIGEINHAQKYIDTNWKILELSAYEMNQQDNIYYIN